MFKRTKQAVDINDAEIAALIGSGFSINGDLTGSAVVRIDGKVLGNIKVDGGVILGETGIVTGNIETGSAIIYGQVTGNVKTGHLEIKKTGKVNGDIKTETVEIELGAHFTGKLEMNASAVAKGDG